TDWFRNAHIRLDFELITVSITSGANETIISLSTFRSRKTTESSPNDSSIDEQQLHSIIERYHIRRDQQLINLILPDLAASFFPHKNFRYIQISILNNFPIKFTLKNLIVPLNYSNCSKDGRNGKTVESGRANFETKYAEQKELEMKKQADTSGHKIMYLVLLARLLSRC
ncbi:3109_t:CDS:2, partial [Funneliformis caledonium]